MAPAPSLPAGAAKPVVPIATCADAMFAIVVRGTSVGRLARRTLREVRCSA